MYMVLCTSIRNSNHEVLKMILCNAHILYKCEGNKIYILASFSGPFFHVRKGDEAKYYKVEAGV